jgi:hypothetical protein
MSESERDREALRRAAEHGHCHGIVTRDGEQDACHKPTVAIIDGRGTEAETYWPACTYHAHRYGDGRVVPLLDVLTDRLAAHEARVRALADRWADVLAECKQADPRWILDRSVMALDTALTELRVALNGGQP